MGKKSRHYRANHGVKRRPMVTGLDNQLLLIARNGSVPIKNKLPPPQKKRPPRLCFVSFLFQQTTRKPSNKTKLGTVRVRLSPDSQKMKPKKKKRKEKLATVKKTSTKRVESLRTSTSGRRNRRWQKKTKQKKTKEKRRSAVPLYGGPLLDDDRCFPDGGGAFGRASLISCCPCSPPHLDIHHTFQ